MEILDEAVEKNESHKQSLYWKKNVMGRGKWKAEHKAQGQESHGTPYWWSWNLN